MRAMAIFFIRLLYKMKSHFRSAEFILLRVYNPKTIDLIHALITVVILFRSHCKAFKGVQGLRFPAFRAEN
jgi:hypothetical protein